MLSANEARDESADVAPAYVQETVADSVGQKCSVEADAGAASDEVILNILSRRREPPRPASIVTPEDMALMHPPVADCARYDSLRDTHAAA